MSLDVHLTTSQKEPRAPSSGIFVREGGKTIEVSAEEWERRNPGREPVRVVQDDDETNEVYWANITHNLGKMADQAGLYDALWRPDEHELKRAGQLVPILEAGLKNLIDRPDHFRQFNPENGWGSYEGLVEFVKDYLAACIEFPDAVVEASR